MRVEVPSGAGIARVDPSREIPDIGVRGSIQRTVSGEPEDERRKIRAGTCGKAKRFAGHLLNQAAEPPAVQRNTVAQARGHGALVMIEEIRPLRAEAKDVSVRIKDGLRFLAQGSPQRFLSEKQMSEVSRHRLKIA